MKLCLVIHHHQPLGVSDGALHEACEAVWLPLAAALGERPGVKAALYQSCVVWDWVAGSGASYAAALRALLSAGRLEILGGGAYEPLLPLLPEEDALAHVACMSRRVMGLLDVLPRGAWLAAPLWEPTLPTLLAKADVEYLVVDASVAADAAGPGPLVVDDRGHTTRLLSLVELASAASVVEALSPVAALWRADEPGVLGVGLDMSRFLPGPDGDAGPWAGLGPGALLDALAELVGEGGMILPAEAVELAVVGRSWPAAGTVTDDRVVSLRENLARRASVDGLYRKTLHVSRKVQFSGRTTPEMKAGLLRGQCATALLAGEAARRPWRRALWRELLTAEDLIDARLHGKGSWVDVDELDYDGDGESELLVGSRQINAYFSPARGGVMGELDFKPRAVNVLDSVARPDAVFRGGFVDLMGVALEDGTATATASSAAGWDPFGRTAVAVVSDRDTRVVFSREGSVRSSGGSASVALEKTFRFVADQPDFRVRYRVVNRGPGGLCLPFGVALTLRTPAGGLGGEAFLVGGREVAGVGEGTVQVPSAQEVLLEDRALGYRVRFQFTMCSRLVVVPVAWPGETCGSVGLLPVWETPLPKGDILELDLAVEFEPLERSDA